MQAGTLRHLITLQRSTEVQDTAGQIEQDYEDIETVRASIEPLSGREYIAAQQVQAEVTTRIQVRYRPGFDATARILHLDDSGENVEADIYDVQAALPDPVSGRRWITFLCIKRVSEGWRRGNYREGA